MRTLALALTFLAAFVGFASTANATASFSLVWTSSTGTGTPGGTAIDAVGGDILTANLLMTAGTEGVASYGVSLRFDADLANELDLVAVTEPAMVGGAVFPCSPFPACFSMAPPALTAITAGVAGTQESTAGTAGFVLTYEATTLALGPTAANGALVIGTVTFSVNSGLTDGVDVELGAFNAGIDGLIDNVGGDQLLAGNVLFGGAAVNGVAPEPGTTTLLGLGLLGLTLAGRRARK